MCGCFIQRCRGVTRQNGKNCFYGSSRIDLDIDKAQNEKKKNKIFLLRASQIGQLENFNYERLVHESCQEQCHGTNLGNSFQCQ